MSLPSKAGLGDETVDVLDWRESTALVTHVDGRVEVVPITDLLVSTCHRHGHAPELHKYVSYDGSAPQWHSP